MTPEETKKAVAVMLAYVEGKAIEGSWKARDEWELCPKPIWNFSMVKYRVKPESWSGKIWVHSDGHTTAGYCTSHEKEFMTKAGYRLIEVKEVTA